MTNRTLEIRPLPALRLAQVRGRANDTTEIPAVVADLVDGLSARLGEAGCDVRGRGIRTFYGHPDGTRIDVAVGIPLTSSSDDRATEDVEVEAIDGVEVVDLPAVDTAAVVVFRGPASEIAEAWRTFDVATDRHGLTPYGVHRQVFLDAGDGDEVVVELQCPVRANATGC